MSLIRERQAKVDNKLHRIAYSERLADSIARYHASSRSSVGL